MSGIGSHSFSASATTYLVLRDYANGVTVRSQFARSCDARACAHMADEWFAECIMNDEWWMMDDGWWMMDDGWWMLAWYGSWLNEGWLTADGWRLMADCMMHDAILPPVLLTTSTPNFVHHPKCAPVTSRCMLSINHICLGVFGDTIAMEQSYFTEIPTF